MPFIIEESLIKKIDEIAGEKHRRAAVIETALREYIARQERKAKTVAAEPETPKSKAVAAAKSKMTSSAKR